MYTEDNVMDIAGYSSCIYRIDEKMKELGFEKGILAFDELDLAGMVKFLEANKQ